ncbi:MULTISPECIES: hypothetical protein [Streptomyces]|nr:MULTISPECIES: hypothetical protein [Streptomyces]
MTKPIRELMIKPLPKRTPAVGYRVTRMGPFTYIPKPGRDDTVHGILAKGGLSVPLDVTGKDLQDLMHALNVLEEGLSRRWMELEI